MVKMKDTEFERKVYMLIKEGYTKGVSISSIIAVLVSALFLLLTEWKEMNLGKKEEIIKGYGG